MVAVIPVMSSKTILTSFGSNNMVAHPYVAPSMMNDTVEIIKKVPKKGGFLRNMAKVLMLGAALGTTGIVATSCANPTGSSVEQPVTPPVDPPVTPPVTPTAADETAAAVETTLEKLDPIVETTSASASASARDLTAADAIKGFSYEEAGAVEDFTVTSVDQSTGIVTANHTSTEIGTGFVDTDEVVNLSKTDKGFKMTYPSGGYQEFVPLDVPVQRTNVGKSGNIALVRNLEKGTTQGDVLVSDTLGKLCETLSKFKIKK